MTNYLMFIALFFMLIGSMFLIAKVVSKNEVHKKNVLKKATILIVAGLTLFVAGCTTDSAESEEAAHDEQTEIAAEEEAEKEAVKKEEEERKKQEEEEKRKQEEQAAKEKEVRLEEERKQKELDEANPNESEKFSAPTEPVEVPSGESAVEVNGGIPYFSNEDISSAEDYHENGPFDSLGRVTEANAVVGVEIMPAEERGDIGHIEPTGWNQASYANIGSGGWLYNRSHLIGHQMTGNDDPENLMTGTRWFNEQMLEYENFVANYVETTENHVRYRVTPVFEGDNLVASGAYMEGFSIEDNGEGVMFNIYIPNIQLGIEIDYSDGSSVGPEGPAEEGELPNLNEKEEEMPEPEPEPEPEGDISWIDTNGNGVVTIDEAEAAGFSMPIYSDHWLYPYMIDRDGDGIVGE